MSEVIKYPNNFSHLVIFIQQSLFFFGISAGNIKIFTGHLKKIKCRFQYSFF